MGEPARVIFGGDNPEARETSQNPAANDVDQRTLYFEDDIEVTSVMRFGLARAAARAAGNRMQGYRHFEFLARLPKRIIRSSGEGWFLRRCRAPDHGALEAPFLRVFQLADTVLYAVQRDARKSVKPGRIKSSESRDPIVVDSKAS